MTSWHPDDHGPWQDDRWFERDLERQENIADELDRAADRLWERLHKDIGESGQPPKPIEKKRAA